MPKILSSKKFLIPALLLLLFLIILTGFVVKEKSVSNASSILRFSGYSVLSNETTFKNYKSQKTTADKANEHVVLQTVQNVSEDSSNNVLGELITPVKDAQQNFVITDPYSGRQATLKVPDNLKPVQKLLTINGEPVTYYVVFSNEIFSLKIFSEKEAKYEGIFTVYYCPEKKSAYRLEIYSIVTLFDINKSADLLSQLYCK